MKKLITLTIVAMIFSFTAEAGIIYEGAKHFNVWNNTMKNIS